MPTIWDKLQREVTVDDLRRWFRGSEGRGDRPSRQDVDRLIAEAEEEARRRGVTVETVLRERGFDVGDGGAASPEGSETREEILQSMNWKAVRLPEDVRTGQTSGGGPTVLEIPSGLFSAEERCRVETALGAGEIVGQLALVARLKPEQVQTLERSMPGRELREAVLALGLPSDVLLDVADCTPWTIPHRKASAWIDELMMREVAPYRALRQAQERVRTDGGAILACLAEDEQVELDALLSFLGDRADLEVVANGPKKPVALSQALQPWLEVFSFVPIEEPSADTLHLAASFVVPDRVRDALSSAIERSVTFALAAPDAVEAWRGSWLTAARQAGYGKVQSQVIQVRGATRLAHRQIEELERAVRRGSAVELVRSVFEAALASRATDIHIEPLGQHGRVRFRIDGVCMEVLTLSRAVYREVIARIKVLAEMDVTERRRPQDGHVRFIADSKPLDMRIASVPTRQGEKLAVRLIDAGHVQLSLDDIGLAADELGALREVARRPHGLILATGPVGSGKTTTLYACLSEVDRTQVNVFSVEDPVEIELEGANQVEVNRAIGLDFVSGLRALLRQDPDVVLIGEIRDDETAHIGVRAAMTGRLVYSTLHANSAAAAVTTLRNYGIPDFMISASLQGVVAQRLMRRVCSECAEPITLTADEKRRLGISRMPRGFSPQRGRGCEACSGTGYRGRVGIFEFMPIDDSLREMILNGAAQSVIDTYAREQGMNTLEASALALVANGQTTPEERFRVLGG